MPPRRKKAKEPQKEVALAPPDWDLYGHMSGGKIGDFLEIPGEWIWRWPNDKGCRRDVNAEITTWRGMSIGASHFYAKIQIEQQQVWDPREMAWRTFDTHAHRNFAEEKFEADLLDRDAAVAFIEIVLRRFYMGPEYRLSSGVYLEGASGEEGLAAVMNHLRSRD